MGITPEQDMGAMISLGRGTTREEIDAVAKQLSDLRRNCLHCNVCGHKAIELKPFFKKIPRICQLKTEERNAAI